MTKLLILLCLCTALLYTSAQAEVGSNSFLPTWKLLSPAEKQQFIAGYIYGWRDAETVTDIASQYVKENPQRAVEGLEKIKTLYDMSDLKPALVSQAVDTYFSQPENAGASLSQAISAAKGALR